VILIVFLTSSRISRGGLKVQINQTELLMSISPCYTYIVLLSYFWLASLAYIHTQTFVISVNFFCLNVCWQNSFNFSFSLEFFFTVKHQFRTKHVFCCNFIGTVARYLMTLLYFRESATTRPLGAKTSSIISCTFDDIQRKRELAESETALIHFFCESWIYNFFSCLQ
jgi:hypothetical protein